MNIKDIQNEQNLTPQIFAISNSYSKKFFINPIYDKIPKQVKDEIQILCVTYTVDVGGILVMFFDDDDKLVFESIKENDDFSYDEIGARYKLNQIERKQTELISQLEKYYKIIILGEE